MIFRWYRENVHHVLVKKTEKLSEKKKYHHFEKTSLRAERIISCRLRTAQAALGQIYYAGDSKKIYLISRPSMEHGRWKHAVPRRLMRSGVGFWRGVFIIETSAAAARWKELEGVSLFLRAIVRAREGMKDGKEREKERRERESERKIAPRALITSDGLLKL